MKMQVRSGEEVIEVEAPPNGPVTIDGAAYLVEEMSAGLYRVTSGDHAWTVAVAGPRDDRWVSIDGRVDRVEVSSGPGVRRKARVGGPDALTAPMPATVVKLLVETGTVVKHGDTLIVLEAMKMELAVRAPRDGVVRGVKCRVGELVQPGVALLEIE